MVRNLLSAIQSRRLKIAAMLAVETGGTLSEISNLKWENVNLAKRTVTIIGVKGHKGTTYQISENLANLLSQLPNREGKILGYRKPRYINEALKKVCQRLARETGNQDYLKISFHTLRHFAISWFYFKTKDPVATQRFARHHNIQNTLRYIHIVKSWIKEDEYDVVYARSREELAKYLAEGYEFITKTEWGYCLRKPKTIT